MEKWLKAKYLFINSFIGLLDDWVIGLFKLIKSTTY